MVAWTLLSDLDDTLIPNTHKYGVAAWRCGLIIAEALGPLAPRPLTIITLQGEIDVAMVKERGLQLDRFPSSWVETYVRLCTQVGMRPKEAVKRRLFNTAARFKYGPFRPFNGVKKALREIREMSLDRHMITAGVDSLQQRKVDQAGLRPYFDSVHVTLLEKKAIMAQLAEDPEHTIMVGDSKRSDIRPAKELGIVTIWTPGDTWSFADDPVRPDFTASDGFRSVPEIVRKIMRGKTARAKKARKASSRKPTRRRTRKGQT